MNCEYCGLPLTGRQTKYCSKICKNRYFDENTRAEYSKIKGRVIK